MADLDEVEVEAGDVQMEPNPMNADKGGQESVLATEVVKSDAKTFTPLDRLQSAARNLASTVHPKLKKHPRGITIATITIVIDLIGELVRECVSDLCA